MRARDNKHIPLEIMALRNNTIQKRADNIQNSINLGKMPRNPIKHIDRTEAIIVSPLLNIQHPSISTANVRKLLPVSQLLAPNIIQGDYVTMQLLGGIGNRIFQVLAALGYSEKFQKKCVISRSNISNGRKPHENNLDEILSKIFPNVEFTNNVLHTATIKEVAEFKYTPLINCITDVILIGYFQCEKYFPSSSLIPTLKTQSYENTYFIHIRAGDYIGHLTFFHDLSIYYRNCFNILGPHTKYIVFSNDNYYASNYMKQFNIDYVLSDKTNQLDILIEMANCEGGICANSTFSWMGAFFQNKTLGKRFMPSVWMNGSNCNGIYPNWATVIDIHISNISQCNLYDIIIPVGPSDYDIITKQIQYTKRNIEAYRNIYIISTNKIPLIEGCIIIDENIFPFTLKTVEEIHGKNQRNGWYLQQLLKLYAGRIIPGILNTYLVIDCDTFFLRSTRFMLNNKCLYNYGTEYNIPYFKHMSRLHPSFKKMNPNISGICHHMIFQNKYIDEIFNLVEGFHSMPFYKVFLNTVTEIKGSGASEYELYFNYMIQNHSDKLTIRPLQWNNVSKLSNTHKYDYESVHHYSRDTSVDNNSTILPIANNVYNFNSLKVLGKYVIIDICRSSKYNSLVFICNNRKYIQEECKIDILSLRVESYILKNIKPDLSKDYIEIDRFNVFKERYHHEVFYIEHFPENVSNLTISLNNINYSINIPKIDTKFVKTKCLTTIQKGEIHLIESWIQWHKRLGFEYFFIYDNNFNVNNYSELFKKYTKELIVYNADFPYWLESYGKNSVGQCIQQSHALWKFSPEFLGLTDLDEYIYPLSNFNIFNKDISVLSIPNHWFGCSGNKGIQKNIMQSYTKRAFEGNIIHNRKCIIQSSQVDLACVHIALNYNGVYKRSSYSDVYLRHYRSLSNKKRYCNCSEYCVIEDIPRV
jgi:hypothetical protein